MRSLATLLFMFATGVASVPSKRKSSVAFGSYVTKPGEAPPLIQKYTEEAQWLALKHSKKGKQACSRKKKTTITPTTTSGSKSAAGQSKSGLTTGLSSLLHKQLSKYQPSWLHKRSRNTDMEKVDPNSGHMMWVNLQVGSEKVDIPFMVDTGSYDVVLPLEDCTKCVPPKFDETDSETWSMTAIDITMTFMDTCSAVGYVAADSITYEPPKGAALEVEDQPLIAITADISPPRGSTLADNDSDDDSDEDDDTEPSLTGVYAMLGLDYGSTSLARGTRFIDNLVAQGAISRPYFSMYFAEPSIATGEQRSSICFGCIDSDYLAKVDGEPVPIVYQPLVKGADSWRLQSTGLFVGDPHMSATGPFKIDIDSGASLMYVQKAAAEAFYGQIPKAERFNDAAFMFPCSTDLPEISLELGTERYTINPEYFNQGWIEGLDDMCLGGILQWEDDELDAVVGGIFLKDRVAVFEQDRARVGFADGVDPNL